MINNKNYLFPRIVSFPKKEFGKNCPRGKCPANRNRCDKNDCKRNGCVDCPNKSTDCLRFTDKKDASFFILMDVINKHSIKYSNFDRPLPRLNFHTDMSECLVAYCKDDNFELSFKFTNINSYDNFENSVSVSIFMKYEGHVIINNDVIDFPAKDYEYSDICDFLFSACWESLYIPKEETESRISDVFNPETMNKIMVNNILDVIDEISEEDKIRIVEAIKQS